MSAIERLFTAILPSIEHFHLLGYWIAFFGALAETVLGVGLLLPGSTLLLLLGTLAASGYLDFGDLLWFAVAGAVLGDNVNYWRGARYGQRWTRGGVWFLTPSHFERARFFFRPAWRKKHLSGAFGRAGAGPQPLCAQLAAPSSRRGAFFCGASRPFAFLPVCLSRSWF